MHIPDGFLDAKTALATAALGAIGLGVALAHARRALAPRKVPLLGLSAAFVFAAQMINFPVGAGTSGHLMGGVLAAALLGPSAAVIVLSTVLIVQCFAFADGGITALGANIFNMGIVGGVGGWAIYAMLNRLMGKPRMHTRIFAAIVAAWMSTVLSAVMCAGELAASGAVAWGVVFPAMTGVHMVIAVGEGVITALVLSAIGSVRPELVLQPAEGETPGGVRRSSLVPILVFGLLVAAGVALFLSPFASRLPDGLEAVAQGLGIAGGERAQRSLLADYTPVAAGIATVLLFPLAWAVARSIVRARPESVQP